MHRAKQVWQWMRSLAAKTWQRTRSWRIRVASLLKKPKSQQAHDLIPPLGILMGAVAFGLWWQSFAAAFFAVIGLFFLTGIYRTTERMLTAVRRSEGEPRFGNLDARALADPIPEKSDALNEAIGCLKPWLANEVSLTEENAKECCAVLLDSVVERARAVVDSENLVEPGHVEKTPGLGKGVGDFQLVAAVAGENEQVHQRRQA